MPATVHYENILRTIGQRLESLHLEWFELAVSDGSYIAEGDCRKTYAVPSPAPVATKSFLASLLGVGRKQPAEVVETRTEHFSDLRFTDADLELADQKGRVLRAKSDDSVLNPHSISHALRMAGAYLDHRKGRLLRLSWRQQTLTLWHVNMAGGEEEEKVMPAHLFKTSVDQI